MVKPRLKPGIRPVKKPRKKVKAPLPVKLIRKLPKPPEPLRKYLPPPPKYLKRKRTMGVREWLVTLTMRKRGVTGQLERIIIHNLQQDYKRKRIGIGRLGISIPTEKKGWKHTGAALGAMGLMLPWAFASPTTGTMRAAAKRYDVGKAYYATQAERAAAETDEKHTGKKLLWFSRPGAYKVLGRIRERGGEALGVGFDIPAYTFTFLPLLVPALQPFGAAMRTTKAVVRGGKAVKTALGARKVTKVGRSVGKAVRTVGETGKTLDDIADVKDAAGGVIKHTDAAKAAKELEESLEERLEHGIDLLDFRRAAEEQVAATQMGQREADYAEQRYAPAESALSPALQGYDKSLDFAVHGGYAKKKKKRKKAVEELPELEVIEDLPELQPIDEDVSDELAEAVSKIKKKK